MPYSLLFDALFSSQFSQPTPDRWQLIVTSQQRRSYQLHEANIDTKIAIVVRFFLRNRAKVSYNIRDTTRKGEKLKSKTE